MPSSRQSLEELIAQVTQAVSEDLSNSLRPIIRELSQAVAALENALGGGAGTKPRRGRPPKKRRGRPPGVASLLRMRRAGGRKRSRRLAPRGALRDTIRKALMRTDGSGSLIAIRDYVIKTANFKGRDPMSLYRQIVRDIAKMDDVKKVSKGRYQISARR